MFRWLLRRSGQVDLFPGEGPLVGAAEQEQSFGEVDSSGIDRMETIDEYVRSSCRIVADDVEKSLGDRERGSQFVGALAVNLCCSASCASSRASIVSKASASSRNSSRRPSSWIRWESDPFAAMRVASVMRASGASIRPRSHPPTRPNTSRNANAAAAFGAKARQRSDRSGPGRTKRPGGRIGASGT